MQTNTGVQGTLQTADGLTCLSVNKQHTSQCVTRQWCDNKHSYVIYL